MIKHHPNHELLHDYVAGQLPASLSAAIAIHADLCDVCQQQILAMTDEIAETTFEEAYLHTFQVDDSTNTTSIDFDNMINQITASNEIDEIKSEPVKTIKIKDMEYILPRALHNMPMGNWSSIGKLTKARLPLNEGVIHTNLLQIQPGGTVPCHTHKGFELTLLLDGSFEDEMGTYHQGDFIMLDGQHTHTPTTKNGCLCYTVANDAQHFTHGLPKLLNPFGSFIY